MTRIRQLKNKCISAEKNPAQSLAAEELAKASIFQALVLVFHHISEMEMPIDLSDLNVISGVIQRLLSSFLQIVDMNNQRKENAQNAYSQDIKVTEGLPLEVLEELEKQLKLL